MRELHPDRSLPDPLKIKVTEKDLEEAMATAQEKHGIAPGAYVPGMSSSQQPEWSPEIPAAEVAFLKRTKAVDPQAPKGLGSQNLAVTAK